MLRWKNRFSKQKGHGICRDIWEGGQGKGGNKLEKMHEPVTDGTGKEIAGGFTQLEVTHGVHTRTLIKLLSTWWGTWAWVQH